MSVLTAPVRTEAPGETSAGLRRTRSSSISVLIGIAAFLVVWEIVARVIAANVAHPEYVMPDLLSALTTGVPALSDYYSGRFGGTPPAYGGEQTWWMGVLALVENTAISLLRFAGGLALGIAIGVAGGLLLSWSRSIRQALVGFANLARMLPLLAMGPLFTLWFGANSVASIVFIAFCIAPIMLIATMTAVERIDPDQVAYSETLGATRLQVWSRVVPRAIVPEVAASLAVSCVLAWSVLLASELWGIQEGIGWMMGQALDFTQISSVMVIAVAFILLAFASVKAIDRVAARMTRWAE